VYAMNLTGFLHFFMLPPLLNPTNEPSATDSNRRQ